MSDQKYVWSIHWNIKCFKLGTNGKLVSTFCLSDWCLPWTYQTYLRSTQSTGCCNVACKSMYVTSFSLFTCNPFPQKVCASQLSASWNSLPRQCGNMKLMWSILLLVTLTAITVETGNMTTGHFNFHHVFRYFWPKDFLKVRTRHQQRSLILGDPSVIVIVSVTVVD